MHRRFWSVMVLAFGLGAAAGVAFVTGWSGGGWGAYGLAGLGFLLLWPLTWVATLRVVGPWMRLARVARGLRRGALDQRADLDSVAEDDSGGREAGEVAGALRGMADRVVQQLQHQRALLAAVSHELRSPLARLRVLVELEREGRAPDAVHDDLQSEIDAMDALVGDLLAASRIDFEAVAPRELEVADLCARAAAASQTEGVQLDVDRDGVVVGDPTLLTRALAGMLDNAGFYGAPPVVLEVRHTLDEVAFAVLDRGQGFGPGEVEQAFQPFWRRPGSAGRAPRGTGLGLALVRQIAEAHSGTASADNRPDGGATVTLRLPRQAGPSSA